MRRTLLSLGATAVTAAATALVLAPTAPHDDAQDEAPARDLVEGRRPASGYYYEEVAFTPANDKEAHVQIWFTLSIGGAEAARF